jgi:hypothetical protein
VPAPHLGKLADGGRVVGLDLLLELIARDVGDVERGLALTLGQARFSGGSLARNLRVGADPNALVRPMRRLNLPQQLASALHGTA